MSKRSDRRKNPLAALGGFRNFPPGYFEGRGVLPHNPCDACGRGDASRMILARGDRAWLASCCYAVYALDPKDAQDAQTTVDTYWEELPVAEEGEPELRMMNIRLCRACAQRAVERCAEIPLPVPGIYSAAKLFRAEYDDDALKLIDQPNNLHTGLAERGLFLCMTVRDDGEPALYSTALPGLIEKEAVMPPHVREYLTKVYGAGKEKS